MIDDVYDVSFKEVQNVMSLRFNFKIFLGDYFVIKKNTVPGTLRNLMRK